MIPTPTDATLLQFGTGRFLRGFVDLFVSEVNHSPQPLGRIVAVQSTAATRAAEIARRSGHYPIALRGLEAGQRIDRLVEGDSVVQAFSAAEQWDRVLEVAHKPSLLGIVSNATEAAYVLDAEDHSPQAPRSFPARVLGVLQARFEAGGSGLTLLPCELVEHNAQRLQALVLEQAERWACSAELCDWIRHACSWHSTLVDRIVSAPGADDPLAADPLAAVAEPFAFWGIEQALNGAEPAAALAPLWQHPAVLHVERLEPYYLRKVRLLNGAHTALVAKAMPLGLVTVRQAVEHPEIGPWLRRLLFEEIVPVLEGRTDEPARFAEQVLERFANPFLEHRLADIAMHHAVKVQTRLVPTLQDYRERFGREPELLGPLLAGV